MLLGGLFNSGLFFCMGFLLGYLGALRYEGNGDHIKAYLSKGF